MKFALAVTSRHVAKKQLSMTLVLLLFLLSACSTIRLRYAATAAGSDGADRVITVEKSYPIEGAYKPLCYLTAIGFGGSCWFYLAMPTTEQRQIFKADAQSYISKKLSLEKFEPKSEKIDRVSWENAETTLTDEAVKF